uniref:c-type cytochrome n=1 Tax=Pararhizobium sp. IMCC3301 TaxID=3067904 RepID=UPI00274092D3|nr:c-type cytochrome [Pararhizobium sp. IMCC3301]
MFALSSLLAATLASANGGYERLAGHGGPVMGVATNPDNGTRLTASFDYSIGYWPASGTNHNAAPLWLEGHRAAANSVAFLGNHHAVSGGDDYALIIWDLQTGQPLHRLQGHQGKVQSVAVSPDARLIASAGWDGRAGLWDASTGQLLNWLQGHTSAVNDVAFSSDSAILYTASTDGTIRSWTIAEGSQRRVEVKHGFGVNTLVVNDAAGWLAYGGLDGGTRIIDIASGNVVADVTLDRRPILSLALSNDKTRLAVGDGDGYIMVLDTSDWTIARDFRAAKSGPVWALAYASDGRLLSGGLDRSATLWPQEGSAVVPGMAQQPFHRPPSEMQNGERQFVRKCSICHSLGTDPTRQAGPPLGGLFGRAAGTVSGYNYSPALRKADLIWGDETIDALFRVGPDELTPGSKMPMQRITAAQDRVDLVNYLRSATSDPKTSDPKTRDGGN